MAHRSGIFAHTAIVKITYPAYGRRKRKQFVKGFETVAHATAYAKKAADRGTRSSIMGFWQDNPIACVYDLRKWSAPVACYATRPPESSKTPGHYIRGGNITVRKVPATFSGYSKRNRRARRVARRAKRR